jgi:hypothetical protein
LPMPALQPERNKQREVAIQRANVDFMRRIQASLRGEA